MNFGGGGDFKRSHEWREVWRCAGKSQSENGGYRADLSPRKSMWARNHSPDAEALSLMHSWSSASRLFLDEYTNHGGAS
ncbi:hypothetical protein OIU84_021002 [Salix udensis]|uniref:Uncharacterized protein n=1 Tax=Salix udensis TaxID=889485 RepID=A0AAD6KTM2_9ROSI|nr:hypothetical protein OIU84_021002 [Salix udensis]